MTEHLSTSFQEIRAELEAAGKTDHYLAWCIGATPVKSLPREQIPVASTILSALLDVAEAAQAVALKPYGNWKNEGCSCLACARRALGEALARLNPPSTSTESAPCGLCGRDPAAGTAGAWNDGVETRLCHGDDDPVPTCYSRWLHGERPLLPQGEPE